MILSFVCLCLLRSKPTTIGIRAKDNMNHIPNASNLSKGMAHYWFELDEKNKNYFLFCQTSDRRIFHATKHQLMEFIGSSGKKNTRPLLLKPWAPIGTNGKRTRKGGIKGEEEDEEEVEGLPEKKKRKVVVVLPAPLKPLPELPAEMLVMILDGMSNPTPAVRRFIFNALKGSMPNLVSFHLSNSRTIWKWYRETLDRDPPLALAPLEVYYKQRGDLNGFARRWYSGFVRTHDVMDLAWLWRYYKQENQSKMKKKLDPTTMYILMMHLRGRTIGAGVHEGAVAEYERVEMEIQRGLDSPHTVLSDIYVHIPEFMLNPLRQIMLQAIEAREALVHAYLFRRATWYATITSVAKDTWFLTKWNPSRTRHRIDGIIKNTLQLSTAAIKIIRGIGPEQKFTARDLTAYVWLNQVIIRLLYAPLKEAMKRTSLQLNLIFDLREELRLAARSKEQQITEDKLLVHTRASIWRQREEDYFNGLVDLKAAWKKKWRRPPKPKKMTKGKEKVEEEEPEEKLHFLDYDDDDDDDDLMETTNTQFWN